MYVAAVVMAVAILASGVAGAAAPARAASYGDGVAIPFLLLPADNPWNTPVDSLPLDPESAAYIAHMDPAAALHPDFGTVWEGARIGIPYIVVPGTQPKVPVHFIEYGEESDPGPYPVPPEAPVEGAGGLYADGDRHVLVLDADNRKVYELYHAEKRADGSWERRVGSRVRPDDERAAAGRLDVGGRSRPADPARTRPVRRDRRRGRAGPRVAVHRLGDAARLRVPGDALRELVDGRRPAADGAARAAARRLRRVRVPAGRADHPPGAQEVRDDGRRQRCGLVRHRGAGRALGRRRPAQAGGGQGLGLRGRGLARAAAGRVLREPARDGDRARGVGLDVRRRVLRRHRRALDGDRGLRRRGRAAVPDGRRARVRAAASSWVARGRTTGAGLSRSR